MLHRISVEPSGQVYCVQLYRVWGQAAIVQEVVPAVVEHAIFATSH